MSGCSEQNQLSSYLLALNLATEPFISNKDAAIDAVMHNTLCYNA